MLDYIFIIKFVIALSFILALSILSEKIGPKYAGIISGFPTGTAITLFFFGLENGTEFAAKSAVYNLAGMVALQVFIYTYYKASLVFKRFEILASSLFALSTYFISIYLINLIHIIPIFAVILLVVSIPIFIYLMKDIKEVKIKKSVKITPSILIFRSVFATIIIVFIIMIAKVVGPQWAGLFSAFSTTLFPLILITQISYGNKPVHTIIKYVPQGLWSMIFFSCGVYFFYPLTGIYWGTLIAYSFVGMYLFFAYLYSLHKRKF